MAFPASTGRTSAARGNGPAAATGAASTSGAPAASSNNNARKRPAVGISISVGAAGAESEVGRTRTLQAGGANKKVRVGTAVGIASPEAASGMKREENTTTNSNTKTSGGGGGVPMASKSSEVNNFSSDLKRRFVYFLEESSSEAGSGIPNSVIKEKFKNEYSELVPVINELMTESRLSMSQNISTGELYYSVVNVDIATKLSGLDNGAKMVYQVIQKAGDMGIWTKIIRTQTNIEQQTLNKIFKVLESRKLIKPVKSVTAKSKKIYMLYELKPSKELTGGVWYSDFEFDHEFINELRTFAIQCIRRLNNGNGVTTKQILEKIIQAKVSKVELTITEVQQLIETLIYDYLIEEETSANSDEYGEETVYVAARRVTPMSEFKWWDSVLSSDFKYRTIKFEDGVTLSAHEPHYHTA